MADPIDRLRAQVAALPPGPHEVEAYPYLSDVPDEVSAWVPSLATVETSDGHTLSQPTAETIAALVTLAPELLAIVEAAERSQGGIYVPDPDHEPGECWQCDLARALAALRARAAEVLP